MNESASPLRDLFLLDPSIIFLNHGSFGACPRPVFEEYQRWQLELEREPVQFLARRFDDLMRQAREALASYVHCDADDLVNVPNTTTGLNIIARSLALQPGDEILSTDHEYGALDRTWRFICQKTGAVYLRQPIAVPTTTADALVEQFWAGVTPRTRVVFISHITSPTSLIFPVAELCRRARKAGIISIVDGAHAPGQIPINLEEIGADFYSASAHKWMLSPKGSGFLYARREMQAWVEPLVVSWGWQPDKPGPSKFVQEQEWQGTRDIAAYLAVPSAIRFMQENNWERVRGECHELARYARQRIAELTGLGALSADSSAWYAQMVSLPLPPCDGEALCQQLYKEYRIQAPVIAWNGRRLIRVSVQGYNTLEDINRLVSALAVLLPQVREGAFRLR